MDTYHRRSSFKGQGSVASTLASRPLLGAANRESKKNELVHYIEELEVLFNRACLVLSDARGKKRECRGERAIFSPLLEVKLAKGSSRIGNKCKIHINKNK